MRQGQLSGKVGLSPWPAAPARLAWHCLFHALALSIGLSVAACSSDEATSSPPSSPASQLTASGRRLRVLGEDSASLAAFEKTKASYEATRGVSVEIVRRDHAGLIAKLRGAPARSMYDLLIVPLRMIGELVRDAYVQPIDVFLSDASSFDRGLFDAEKNLFPAWWSQLSWYVSDKRNLAFVHERHRIGIIAGDADTRGGRRSRRRPRTESRPPRPAARVQRLNGLLMVPSLLR